MIEYIKGTLTELTPTMAVVEANGVGYALGISLVTFSAIQPYLSRAEEGKEGKEGLRVVKNGKEGLRVVKNGKEGLGVVKNGKEGNTLKLYVHEQLVAGGRDDSFTLFGFATKQERELYRLLLLVNGVGGNTARMILSAMSPQELCNAISLGDERMLKMVKGIGPKAAQRIILELRDKIAAVDVSAALPQGEAETGKLQGQAVKQVRDEAVSALTMLGFSPAPTAKAVNSILQKEPDLPVEQVIKTALKMIK